MSGIGQQLPTLIGVVIGAPVLLAGAASERTRGGGNGPRAGTSGVRRPTPTTATPSRTSTYRARGPLSFAFGGKLCCLSRGLGGTGQADHGAHCDVGIGAAARSPGDDRGRAYLAPPGLAGGTVRPWEVASG